MSKTKPRTIAFISGKGGSGKTTVAIAIAKLLADMKHPCLLIDFDLATNGASYFFRERFDRESNGIWELLTKEDSSLRNIISLFSIPVDDVTIHELNRPCIPHGIRTCFTEHGISLSKDANISIRRSVYEWLITDAKKKYFIMKIGNKLQVCEPILQKGHVIITINGDFYFVPSRTNLNVKGESYDSVRYDTQYLQKELINPLVDYATQIGVHYVLIDCQAGYSIPAIAAVEDADMAVIVSEPDSISSDAADNLVAQLGSALPNEKRYLVNKVDVRDADTYRATRNAFQLLNRLPPLPFDFDVRNAFGTRHIPVDLDKPSSFLFALFETAKYMFTEILEDIDSYKKEHVDSLFEEYDKELQSLVSEKERLEEEQIAIKTRDLRSRYNFVRRLSTLAAAVIIVLGFLFSFDRIFRNIFPYDFYSILTIALPLAATGFGAALALLTGLTIARKYRESLEDEKSERDISRRLEAVNREIDQFRSFLWAKSRDFLVDAEIVGRTRYMQSDHNPIEYYLQRSRSPDIETRLNAIQMLSQIGANDEDCIRRLQQMHISDDVEEVRASAGQAINLIMAQRSSPDDGIGKE